MRSAAFSSPPHDSRRSVPMATRLPILTPGIPRCDDHASTFRTDARAAAGRRDTPLPPGRFWSRSAADTPYPPCRSTNDTLPPTLS